MAVPRLKFIAFFCIFLLSQAVSGWSVYERNQPYDHSLWDSFLKKYVNEAGEMDYAAASKDPSLLNQYLELYSKMDVAKLNIPREEALAFWLNLYHAALVKKVLEKYPIKSILDIPSVWDASAIHLGNEQLSLNQIRNEKLMGTFRDEKINVVLACTGRSCPGFKREAFTGPKVEGQLFLYAREFVNSSQNDIVPGKKKIYLSRIFKWYAKDFSLDFGQLENDRGWSGEEFAVVSFVANYLDDAEKKDFLERGKYKVKYLPFSWALAEWKSSGSTASQAG